MSFDKLALMARVNTCYTPCLQLLLNVLLAADCMCQKNNNKNKLKKAQFLAIRGEIVSDILALCHLACE